MFLVVNWVNDSIADDAEKVMPRLINTNYIVMVHATSENSCFIYLSNGVCIGVLHTLSDLEETLNKEELTVDIPDRAYIGKR